MISVNDATHVVLSSAAQFSQRLTSRSLDHGQWAYLNEAIYADRDFPPFDRVAMDGIALSATRWQQGLREYSLAGMQAAGSPLQLLSNPDTCIEVMTGARLPSGCDAVVRYEDLTLCRNSRRARLTPHLRVFSGLNIHQQASDKRRGDLLCTPGSKLLPPHWAVLASVGTIRASIVDTPQITLLASGDELVAPHLKPLSHEIRASNPFAIAAALRDRGFTKISIALVEDKHEQLCVQLSSAIAASEVCIISGGVSAGARDLVPQVLEEIGVRKIFHHVAQRPGKPLWFGEAPGKTLVFALPGNPVAALFTAYRYVLPALQIMSGQKVASRVQAYGVLSEALSSPRGADTTLFAPVRISFGNDGLTRVCPLPGIGSGDLAALTASDGFVECPAGRSLYAAGEALPLYSWGVH